MMHIENSIRNELTINVRKYCRNCFCSCVKNGKGRVRKKGGIRQVSQKLYNLGREN